MVAEGLFYTEDHEWAKIDGDIAVTGITDYAQEMLGEVTYVELPVIDKDYKQKDEMAVVESSKAASDIYSPVTGKVTAVNNELESKPELINNGCYGQGWICRIKISDTKSAENLMDAKQYEQYLKGL